MGLEPTTFCMAHPQASQPVPETSYLSHSGVSGVRLDLRIRGQNRGQETLSEIGEANCGRLHNRSLHAKERGRIGQMKGGSRLREEVVGEVSAFEVAAKTGISGGAARRSFE